MLGNIYGAVTGLMRSFERKDAVSSNFRWYMFASQRFAGSHYLSIKDKVKEIVSMYTSQSVLNIAATILWLCPESYMVGIDNFTDNRQYVVFYSDALLNIVNNMNLASVNLNVGVSCEVYDDNYMIYIINGANCLKRVSSIIGNEASFASIMANTMCAFEDKCSFLLSNGRFILSSKSGPDLKKVMYARGPANMSEVDYLHIDSDFSDSTSLLDSSSSVLTATKTDEKSDSFLKDMYDKFLGLFDDSGDVCTISSIYDRVANYNGPYCKYVHGILSSIDINAIKYYYIFGFSFDIDEYHNMMLISGSDRFMLAGLRRIRLDNVLVMLLKQSFFFLKGVSTVSILLNELLSVRNVYVNHNCGCLSSKHLSQLFALVCLYEVVSFIDKYYDPGIEHDPLVLYNEERVMYPCVKDRIKTIYDDYYNIYSLYKNGKLDFSGALGFMFDFVSDVLCE